MHFGQRSALLAFLASLALVWGSTVNETSLENEKSGPNLVTVVLVFRHGDRVPIKPYPTDPYKDNSYWPVGWGQLTNRGKQQHYELGQWFRRRYANFLPEEYSEKNVYVRSTDVDRTLMSAQANLAGLFVPQGKQIWNPNLAWQPIPVHTKAEKDDALLAMKRSCPKYDILIKKLKHSQEILNINKKNQELYRYLTEKTGKKINSIQEMEYVYSCLNIERIYNLTLPAWTEKVFPDKMKPTADLSFALPCYNEQLSRLKVGPFMAEMIDHLLNTTVTMKHKYNRKLWMYSGHDTTVANILNGMKVFQYHAPPYLATIMFELYSRNDDDFYVNILYKNSSIPQKMTLPGCEFDCPFSDFIRLLKPVTLPLDDWVVECQPSLMSYLPFNEVHSVFVLSCLGLLVIMLIVLLVGVLVVKRHQERRQHFNYFRIPDRDETA